MDTARSRAGRAGDIAVNISFLLIGTVFVLVNCYLLGHGAAKWGYSDTEKYAYGIVGGATAIILALLPSRLNLSWHPTFFGLRRPGSGTLVLVALWTLFIVFNIVNGGGTIAFARSDVIASRESEASSAGNLKEARARLASEAGTLPSSRPADTLPPLIAAEKNKRLYEVTGRCRESEINGKTQRNFCNGILALESELGTARRRSELELKIAELDAKLETKGATATASADPQVDMIHELSCSIYRCFDKKSIGLWLPAMVPIVLEAGASTLVALGLIGLGFGHGHGSNSSPARPGQPGAAAPILVSKEQIAAAEARSLTTPEMIDRRRVAQQFFANYTQPIAGASLSERDWYDHYCHFCRLVNADPLPLATFQRVASSHVSAMRPINGEMTYFGTLPMMDKAPKKQAAE